ncbi:MgtC/SapB family protein [Oceaniglobus indicus]|uniref:MgtC/SapB family protein n=1 Tax=Oceaniglobus indicus TaxID=2047749 RepID=UPI001F4EF7D5|nr:MgtC/SapB family protein [Oceaniglobus indicus]
MIDSILNEFGANFSANAPSVVAVRLLLALVLGGMIGMEREVARKPAGLRTHILVSVAACLFMLVSQELAILKFGDPDQMRVDPLRLVEAVTAGVAFLGAGAIFRADGEVRNITTGTSMWLAGAVGLACGAGQIWLAAMAAIMVVVVIAGIGWMERKFAPDDQPGD